MKVKVIILISLFFSYGCIKKVEKKAEISELKINQLENSVIGSWQMCKSIEKGNQTLYNICPTITFSGNGTGNILSSNKHTCNFQYELKEKIILFSFKSAKDKEAFFANGTEFNFGFQVKQDNVILELTQVNTDYKFILSKIK